MYLLVRQMVSPNCIIPEDTIHMCLLSLIFLAPKAMMQLVPLTVVP